MAGADPPSAAAGAATGWRRLLAGSHPAGGGRGALARDGQLGLDLLNFFVANLQTAFGPFVSVYLTGQAWTQGQIGLALSIGTVTAMVSQVPAGALVDAMRRKRAAAAAAILAIIAGSVVLAIWPARLPVALGEVLHGFASCMLTPAIAAISLAAATRVGMPVGERFGRNARWASIGNGLAAGLMGLTGYWVAERAVFLLAAVLAVPGLLALRLVPSNAPEPVDVTGRLRTEPRLGLRRLLTDRRLLAFAGCVGLFHLANAAMLPLAASEATERIGSRAELVIAACIVVPQMVVALMSPAVGRAADRWGRRPVMVLGFLALPLRGALLSWNSDAFWLIPIEVLDGVSGAVFGVMLPLVVSDITAGTGRFNLCMGVLGLVIGLAATLSTSLAGMAADRSINDAFLLLAWAGVGAVLLSYAALPETRPTPR